MRIAEEGYFSSLEPMKRAALAGVMGFKRDFHPASIELGRRLMRKIEQMNPETLLTDCLSCRLQFNQELQYPVKHPIEFLAESCRQGSGGNLT
jgi:glycerol-3-phosphate dehydrogenase subunit C